MSTQESTDTDSTDHDYEGTTWVIFIDSYGARDISKTPWIYENCSLGKMDARPVYVTPTVLGQIYTGTNPAENGLPAVSRYDQAPRLRPAQPTIPELAAMDDTYENVLQLGLPFIVPPDLSSDPPNDGVYWHSSGAMQQQVNAPGEAANLLTIAGPAGDVEHETNQEMVFNLLVDHCQSTFSTARTLAAGNNFDLVFVAIRTPDSYAHYRHLEGPDDGSGKSYRDLLLEEIDNQVRFCSESGDVFVFGDHGARPLDDVFRINRWLIENDYLSVSIDHDYREKLIEDEFFEIDEKSPGETIAIGQPGVTVHEDESVAIAADPFSTGITLLDAASPLEVGNLMSDLEELECADRVFLTSDMWDGPLLEEAPDIYIERHPGWFVSGNLAEEPGGVEVTRSGVHDPVGAYGTTADIDMPSEVSPVGLFDVITSQYLGIPTEPPEPQEGAGAMDMSESERREMQAHLEEMGYL